MKACGSCLFCRDGGFMFFCFMKLYFASSVIFASIFIEGAEVADV